MHNELLAVTTLVITGFISVISELLILPKNVLFGGTHVFSVFSRIMNLVTVPYCYLKNFLQGFKLYKNKISALFTFVLLTVLAKFVAHHG